MDLKYAALDSSPTINVQDSGSSTYSACFRIYTLKKVLLAAGWQIVVSGDGTTKSIGLDNSGAMTLTNAWFIIRDPAGQKCFGFQKGTTANQFTLKYIGTGGVDTSTGTGSVMSSALVVAEDKVLYNNISCDYSSGTIQAVADADPPLWVLCDSNTRGPTNERHQWLFDDFRPVDELPSQ